MVTEKQREANRRNAQLSTGPRTDAGKDASRVNALKHGLRARAFDVLPNEDPAEFRARLDAWADDLQPADHAEAHLVHHIATLDWRKERLDRYEHAALSKRVRDAVTGVEEAQHSKLVEAYEQLLPDAFAYAKEFRDKGPDGLNLGQLRQDVEASAEGCRWLLEVWAPMLRAAKDGSYWTEPQEFHAIRLLSKGPEPWITDPAILDFVVADRMLLLPTVELTPENWTDGLGVASRKHAVILACERKPSNRAEAAAVLVRVAENEVARLEGVLAVREREGDLHTGDAEEAGLLAMFDPSTEGERLRRYQLSLDRELRRALEALAKLRKEREKRANEADAAPGKIGTGTRPPGESVRLGTSDRPGASPIFLDRAPIEPNRPEIGRRSNPFRGRRCNFCSPRIAIVRSSRCVRPRRSKPIGRLGPKKQPAGPSPCSPKGSILQLGESS